MNIINENEFSSYDYNNECIICLEQIILESDNLMFFKPVCGCEVVIHYNCGNKWLIQNIKCPICAKKIDPTNIFTNNINIGQDICHNIGYDTGQDICHDTEITVNSSNNKLFDNYYNNRRKLFILFIFISLIIIISFFSSN